MRWLLRLFLTQDERRRLDAELNQMYESKHAAEGSGPARAWLRRQHRAAAAYALKTRTSDFLTAIREAAPTSRRDFTRALKTLARTPGLTATVVLTVAVGLGTTTAMFAVVRQVLVAPLPYDDAGSLAWIYTDNPPFKFRFSVVDYRALAADHPGFVDVAAYQTTEATITGAGAPQRVTVKSVTGSYFPLLRQRSRLGRLFDQSDDTSREPLAVLTHAYWRQAFGGDESVVGKRLIINDLSHAIVGVLEESDGPFERNVAAFTAERWPEPRRKGPFFTMAIGRLRSDMPADAVRDTLRATNARLFPIWQSTYQDRNATWNYQDLKERVVGHVEQALWLVLAGLGCVLLIALSNSLHLLVGRALDRQREWAIRRALGGSRAQLIRPLLLESLCLAGAAGAGGVLICQFIVGLVHRFGGPYIPRVAEVGMTTEIWTAAALLTIVCALAFLIGGLLPALRDPGRRLDASLKAGGRSTTDGPVARRLRRVLVGAQVALTVPLLVAAVMVTVSLQKLAGVPVGIDSERILTARVALQGSRYASEPQRTEFWRQLLERLEQLPGVEAAALADSRPPSGAGNLNNFNLEDRPTPANENQPLAIWVSATPGYFKTVGLRLERGQPPDQWSPADNSILVDRAWADRFFPGQEVLGRRLRSGGCTDCPWTTVVGVVGTVKWQGLEAPDDGAVYYPFVNWPSGYVVVRTGGDPALLASSIRQTVVNADPHLAVIDIATGTDLLSQELETPRYLTFAAAAFGLIAFILAAAGIYAILSHFVRQHRSEIGVRLALGGRPADVRRLVLAHGLRVVVIGLVAGSGVALLWSNFLTANLYGTPGTTPLVISAVSVALILLALATAVGPGRMASRVDPATILREQ